ncbi:MAG: two-component regulator propeller domain-containing protein [Ignavibacteriaceae bacterium]|nr:two-component regulator propeller domain-containing protein [Ignavibacteriaceae bacterium]
MISYFNKLFYSLIIKKTGKISTLLILILGTLLPSEIYSQLKDTPNKLSGINFEHILSDKGLSQNTIHCILQDSQGFIWFATEDGLDKYDGYNFTVYKNNPLEGNSISDNFIWTIYEDRSGTLWIGTNSCGISKFDRQTEKFKNYTYNPNNPNCLSNNNVRAILEDSKGNLWIGTEGGGLNKFDRKKQKFTTYYHNPLDKNSLSNNVVISVFEDKSGFLWLGTDAGLDKFDPKTGHVVSYHFESNNPNSISNNVIFSIYEDHAGRFWVGTSNGLNLFDRKTGKFSRFFSSADISSNLDNGRINAMLEDKTGIFWVATGGGLYQFNVKKKKFISLNETTSRSTLLSNNNILSLYEDNSGLIWVGTAEGGIIKYDRERIKFKNYIHDIYDKNSLSYNTVRAIYQDKSGLLWIGTLGGGINKYDAKQNIYSHFLHQSNNSYSLSNNSVSSIFRDKSGTLWVGTWDGGLNKLINSSDVKFMHYIHNPSNPFSLSSNIVQSIYEDSKGRFWVGTGIGLDIMDRKSGKFYNYTNNLMDANSISDNQIQSCIKEDRNGNLWVGTWNGLNKLDLSKVPVKPPYNKLIFNRYLHLADNLYSLSDNRVMSIYEDKDGTLWFGTYGGGLNKLTVDQQKVNSEKAHFVNYSIKDGLTSNIIYCIVGDDEGNLWLSTDNGLSKFNPKTKIFRNYYENDGLQGNQFYWGASFKGNNGELFLGGTNGVTAFYPSSLRDNLHIPPIVITQFQIFNKPVSIYSEGSPLKKSLIETKEISLTYSQNVFSFEFAALDFTAPGKNQYVYMMDGFDKYWIQSGNRRFVTYTNLDPGEYTFKVRGSNNDGIWNLTGTSIKIIILPPFWRTWWFILISVLTLGGIITSIIIYRVKHLLDIERFRIKLAADLHDNIGSSLTEISILSEVISKKLDSVGEDVIKSLRMISDSSRNLIDNMSDIVWLVNPKRDSLYDLILRLRDTYTELSSYASISFRSENLKSLEKVSLSMEHRQHLYLIFKEGINNCITHSSCTEISLDAFVKGKRLEMVLKDNGKGFNVDCEYEGNGLGNIQRRAKAIGGNINIQSKEGEGTTLQFVGNIL